MFDNEAAYGWAKMHENWADALNFTQTKLFTDALESWRLNTIVNRKVGRPEPAKPEVPQLVTVNMELAKQRYMESLRGGQPPIYDFYTWTPMVVPADAFDLEPKPTLAPTGDALVGGPADREGKRFFLVYGDTSPFGKIIKHSKHGYLVKVEAGNPFNKFDGFWEKVDLS
jgi:hypothetical protein